MIFNLLRDVFQFLLMLHFKICQTAHLLLKLPLLDLIDLLLNRLLNQLLVNLPV